MSNNWGFLSFEDFFITFSISPIIGSLFFSSLDCRLAKVDGRASYWILEYAIFNPIIAAKPDLMSGLSFLWKIILDLTYVIYCLPWPSCLSFELPKYSWLLNKNQLEIQELNNSFYYLDPRCPESYYYHILHTKSIPNPNLLKQLKQNYKPNKPATPRNSNSNSPTKS